MAIKKTTKKETDWHQGIPFRFYGNAYFFAIRMILILFVLIAVVQPHAALAMDWQKLDLSPQQQTQINTLEANWKRTHHQLQGEINRDQAAVKRLLPSGKKPEIQELQKRIMKNKMRLMNESTNTFMKKRDTLSPTQQQKLKQMMPH
ncbi:MAG: Spy/CpxP family protein refolding chaperone [Cyanobacteria bacterium P01_H01_bin.74]